MHCCLSCLGLRGRTFCLQPLKEFVPKVLGIKAACCMLLIICQEVGCKQQTLQVMQLLSRKQDRRQRNRQTIARTEVAKLRVGASSNN